MDDEFARALDVLHNRIDGALETIKQPANTYHAPVGLVTQTQSAQLSVLPAAEKDKQTKSFLVTFFLLGLLCFGLWIV